MALVDCNVRNIRVAEKYDAPPKLVRNESLPITTFDSASFLYDGIGLGANAFLRRACKGDKNGFIQSQSPSSLLARDNPNPNQHRDEDSIRKIDANLFSLLNPSEAKERDQKITDFTDSLCASFGNNSMKIKDNSEFRVDEFLSDFPSTSIQECDPSVRKGYGKSKSPVFNISLNDINIPEIIKVDENVNTSEDSSGKKCIASSESEFNLSDLLSSIYIDDDQPDSNSSSESALQSGDRSLCLDDFNVIGEISKQQLTAKEGIGIVPNCLAFDFCDDAKLEAALHRNLPDSEILDNGITGSRNRLKSSSDDSGIGSSIETLSDKQESLNGINIQDLIEVNINNLGSSLDSNKSTGFSFFCDTSENQLTFSQMLDYDRTTDIAQRSNSNSDQDSISMLDLYNSLQSSKEGTSESNSFTSDEIEKDGDSTSLSSPDDDLEMIAIDLSSCIKSFEDKSSFHPLQLVANPKLQSTPEHIYHDTRILSLPLRNTVSSRAPRMNLKQSLFAKALSCKSKNNASLVHKVANIKAELFTKVFGHLTAIECKVYNPRIEVAAYSDKPITQCNCRRIFGEIESGISPVR